MNNYELKNEAKVYAFNHYGDIDLKGDCLADDVIMERAYLAAAEPRENRIAELEKENAELKALIKSEHEIAARKNNKLVSRIAKAKEIIKELLDFDFLPENEIKKQAEQFLKE